MALTSDDIKLGSGSLYCVEITDSTPMVDYDEIDDILDMCIEANRLSHVKGGATLSYGATVYTAKDDLNLVQKTITTEETIEWKSGLMTWNPVVLEKLAASARALNVAPTTTTLGADGLALGGLEGVKNRKYMMIFQHQELKDYVYFIGEANSSFDLAFQNQNESVIDATFTCVPSFTDPNGHKFAVYYFQKKDHI